MNPIREHLADLAEEVSIVDLHGRALRTSRRMSRTRTAIAGGAALVIGAALTLVGLTLPGRHQALPAVTATPSASPSTPGPVQVARPGSPYVPTLPDPPGNEPFEDLTIGPWTTVGAATPPGDVFLLTDDNALVEIGSGRVRTARLSGKRGYTCALNTVAVSPDGRWIAYVRGSFGGFGHDIVLTDLATQHTTVVPAAAYCFKPAPIAFTLDSAYLIFRRLAVNGPKVSLVDPPVRYRLSDGQVAPAPEYKPGSVSASGFSAAVEDATFAMLNNAVNESGTIVVRDSSGAELRRCPLPAVSAPIVLIGQSTDGRYVSTGPGLGNNSARNATAVLDTTTCRSRHVPTDNLELTAVAFTANGGLMLLLNHYNQSDYHLRVLNPDDTMAADVQVPGAIGSRPQLLRYVG